MTNQMAVNSLKNWVPALEQGWQLLLNELDSTGASDGDVIVFSSSTGTWGYGAPSALLPSLASANIWVGNGSSVATAVPLTGDATLSNAGLLTLTHIRGILLNTNISGIFTNEILQYSGNTAIGMVPSTLKAGTAVSGAVSFTSTQYGTNTIITTDSLTTAAGSTYTITVTDGQLTSTSNYIVSVVKGGATAGQMVVDSIAKSGGGVVFTLRNVDPTNAANGTFILSYIAL